MTTLLAPPPVTPAAADPARFRRVSRIAGVIGLGVLVTAFPAGNDPMFTDASNAEILTWVHHHVTGIYVQGFQNAVCMLLNAALLGILLWRSGVRGWARQVGWMMIGTSLAIDMVNTGASYTLAKLADRGAPDGALLAMFSFIEQATFTDGITWGVVILVAAVASLRAGTLPRAVAWVGLVAVVVHLLGQPVQLLLNGTVQGITGPVSMVCFLLWMLSVTLALLIRPGRPATVG
jgi:hypothetical protein